MKMTLAIVLLTTTLSFGAAAPVPTPLQPAISSPLVDQVTNLMYVDQMYTVLLPYHAWFDGEISAYQRLIPFLGQYGMQFVTDRDWQIAEEQYVLNFVVEAVVLEETATSQAERDYYAGAINGYYRVLGIMNSWPGAGGPVPGTQSVPATTVSVVTQSVSASTPKADE